MISIRTDLALERKDIYQKVNKLQEIDGVESAEEDINENDLIIVKEVEDNER